MFLILQANVTKAFADAFERSKTYKPVDEWLASSWAGLVSPNTASTRRVTGVPVSKLREV